MQGMDDDLAFLDEDSAQDPEHVRQPWRVLVVDDDEDVHQATVFALRDARVLGRNLEFLHAYNSAEALAILRETDNIAAILLDVVMETEDAGLRMVGQIRESLGLHAVRIILRTGQPGYAPDIEAISRYDINDYKTKAELSRSKLYTTLTAAVRSYDQIVRLDAGKRGLELIVDNANRFMAEQGSAAFTQGVIEQLAALIGTEPEGVVCSLADEVTAATPDDEVSFRVLAAVGRHQFMVRRPTGAIDNPHIRQNLIVALRSRKNQIGRSDATLFFASRKGGDFAAFVEAKHPLGEIDAHLLEVFCANVGICADNVELVSRLRETAYVDSLTGLPNRAAFIEAIDRHLASGACQQCVMALIDIDQFSETIDLLGYRYGDQMLIEMSRRLRGALPEEVFLARLSADIFVVFGSEETINPAVLREILADPLLIEGGTQDISISLGFVRPDEDEHGAADFLRYAAIALKRAKADGVGREAYYTPEVAVETRERVRLLQDLREAFGRQHIFAVYQPQIDLESGQTVGLEALMRWRGQDGRFVPPDRFIPVAEQSGLIVSLGAWILRSALMTLAQLHAQGHRLRMAVNVSMIQFRHADFLDTLDEALAQSGIAPEWLELEITESVAMFGQADFEERLAALKARGVLVAIDDFGTGFSSLSYLDRLAADCLKIDRSFVNALDSDKSGARIAEMVVGLGRRLGMRVLAEGVETESQAEILRQLGCHLAQGWLYAKGMESAELFDWLDQRQGG